MSFKQTPLYGGAITTELPISYGDASQIRQIPDHQEVYVDSNGYSSIVFDILERVNEPSDAEALQYHFQDLIAGTGDATNVLNQGDARMGNMPNHPAYLLSFIQTPQPNPRRKEPEFVHIHLILLRLADHETDIVITVNVPHYPGEYEKAATASEATPLMKEGEAITKKILESFEVKDWELFGGKSAA